MKQELNNKQTLDENNLVKRAKDEEKSQKLHSFISATDGKRPFRDCLDDKLLIDSIGSWITQWIQSNNSKTLTTKKSTREISMRSVTRASACQEASTISTFIPLPAIMTAAFPQCAPMDSFQSLPMLEKLRDCRILHVVHRTRHRKNLLLIQLPVLVRIQSRFR